MFALVLLTLFQILTIDAAVTDLVAASIPAADMGGLFALDIFLPSPR